MFKLNEFLKKIRFFLKSGNSAAIKKLEEEIADSSWNLSLNAIYRFSDLEESQDIIELLYEQNRGDFLKKLIEKQLINLNRMINVPDEPFEEGCTLAWLLVVAKKWDALTFVNQFQNIDLSTTLKNDVNKDVSLAFVLAKSEQWALFYKNLLPSQPLDLNLAPTNPENLYQGVSLGWFLSFYGQYTVLKNLAENQIVNLNVTPNCSDFYHYGISLAWMLALDRQWTLLKNLAQNQIVHLDVAPKHMLYADETRTLADLLKHAGQDDLLNELHQQNQRLIPQASINTFSMFISHKYYQDDEHSKMTYHVRKRGRKSTDFDCSSVYSATKMDFVRIASFDEPPVQTSKEKSHTHRSILIEDTIMKMELWTPISKKTIEPSDACYMVMAGRVKEALVPPLSQDSQKRCILILTENEFEQINLHGGAIAYDYLVIHEFFPKPEAKLSAITIRRRAAMHLAYALNLDHMMMIDDNISSFSILNTTSSAFNADDMYEYFKTIQKQYGEPLVSVPTRSSNGVVSNVLDDQLGCKAFMIDIAQLKQHFHSAHDLLALFPFSETVFGEDYFMQIFLHVLFIQSGLQGFKIIEGMDISRSQMHKNACRKSGVRAQPLDLPTPEELEWFHSPRLTEVYYSALALFNAKEEQNLNFFLENEAWKRNLDFAARQAKEFGYNNLSMLPKAYCPPKQNLKNYLTDFLENNITLYPHQKQALSFLNDQLLGMRNSFTIEIATGCGKTLIEAVLAFNALLADPNHHVMLVCPSIQLVNQTRNAFLEYAELVLSPQNREIVKPRILAICTGEISYSAFDLNVSLQKPHIFIICVNSFRELIQLKSKNLANINYIFFDESHLVEKDEHEKTILNVQAEAELEYIQSRPSLFTVCFSATPKPHSRETTYKYSREEGIQAQLLAPLMVDDSFTEKLFSAEQLMVLLESHHHPSHNHALINHKGMIYMPSIETAQQLTKTLKARYPDLPIFEVHSKQQNTEELIAAFKAQDRGIAVVVMMLKEGYDDSKVEWLILNKESVSSTNCTQIIGRLLRRNHQKPKKIGLAIMPKHLNATCQEKTCFPSKMEVPNYSTVKDRLSSSKSLHEHSFLRGCAQEKEPGESMILSSP